LNFNSSFILILMLRHTLTFLRNHGFAAFLPLDQHIYLHKMCGWLILFYALAHTVAHLFNICEQSAILRNLAKYSVTLTP
jgi:hypothetical protein